VEDGTHGHVEGGVNLRGRVTPDLDAMIIDVGAKTISGRLEKGIDPIVQIVDLGFGPFDLRKGCEERRFRFHDIGWIMSKSEKDVDETRLSEVAKRLLSMPPKPREESRLRKHKTKKVAQGRKRAPSVSGAFQLRKWWALCLSDLGFVSTSIC
jgi:hypothetical protein